MSHFIAQQHHESFCRREYKNLHFTNLTQTPPCTETFHVQPLFLSTVILWISADCAHGITTERQCFWWKCEHCEVWKIIITMNYGKMENLSSGSLWWFCLMSPPLRSVFVCIRFSVGLSSLRVDQQGGSFMIVSNYLSQRTKWLKEKWKKINVWKNINFSV